MVQNRGIRDETLRAEWWWAAGATSSLIGPAFDQHLLNRRLTSAFDPSHDQSFDRRLDRRLATGRGHKPAHSTRIRPVSDRFFFYQRLTGVLATGRGHELALHRPHDRRPGRSPLRAHLDGQTPGQTAVKRRRKEARGRLGRVY